LLCGIKIFCLINIKYGREAKKNLKIIIKTKIKYMSATLIILVVLGVIALIVIFMYNGFVSKINQVKNA